MPTDPNKDPIRLLHLSDIHFQAGSTWDSKPVLRELTDWVGKEADEGMSPDLVVITGDLAFSGKQSEYQLARAWLDELWPRLTPAPMNCRATACCWSPVIMMSIAIRSMTW